MYAYVSGCGNASADEQFLRKSTDAETQMQVVEKLETPTKITTPTFPQNIKIDSQDKKNRGKLGIKTQKR